LTDKDLENLLAKCQRQDIHAQKLLYQQFAGYALSVCVRYVPAREEAQEIMHDGFLKVLQNLDKYDRQKQFKLWLRRIMINTAIDYCRKNVKFNNQEILPEHENEAVENGLDNLSAQEILQFVQELSPTYRLIFNLYAIEGYAHKEIAEQLNITEATSRSTLAKARTILKNKLTQYYSYHA
jgi:RNA polymerase sigma-70 factor (ECF subfamily)